jgi:hypothetical protein
MALALTSRRRAWAAGVSVLAAVTLAIAVVGRGCRVGEAPGPETAVRNLLAATRAGDRKAVFALFSPDTQAKLEERAERATDLVGSNIRYTALDLISVGSNEDVPPPTSIGVVSCDADPTKRCEPDRVVPCSSDHKIVEIDSAGGCALLDVVRVKGRWRIDLPDYGTAP